MLNQSIKCTALWCRWPADWDRSRGLPALSCVWHHLKLSDVSLGTRPLYSLVVDEDIKKPTKQKNSGVGDHDLHGILISLYFCPSLTPPTSSHFALLCFPSMILVVTRCHMVSLFIIWQISLPSVFIPY